MKLVRTLSRHAGISLAAVAALPLVAAAAGSDCSFRKKVHKGGYVFNVSSRPAGSCSIQVIRIAVQRYGMPFVQFASDPDVVAEDAWANDLDDDDKPELVVVSRSPLDATRVTLDVYRLDDNRLRRVQLPELAERTGYRGRDSYRLEGNRIVRSFPVYGDSDADDAPTGGSRTLRYELHERQLVLLGQESGPAPAAPAPATTATVKAAPAPPEVKPKKTATPRPTVRTITAGPSHVDIGIDGEIGKVRTFKLPDPERLIIDIPDAVSALRSNVAVIGNFGINKARAGAHKGYFRVVLDATVTPFPAHTVANTATGLRIDFASNTAKP